MPSHPADFPSLCSTGMHIHWCQPPKSPPTSSSMHPQEPQKPPWQLASWGLCGCTSVKSHLEPPLSCAHSGLAPQLCTCIPLARPSSLAASALHRPGGDSAATGKQAKSQKPRSCCGPRSGPVFCHWHIPPHSNVATPPLSCAPAYPSQTEPCHPSACTAVGTHGGDYTAQEDYAKWSKSHREASTVWFHWQVESKELNA